MLPRCEAFEVVIFPEGFEVLVLAGHLPINMACIQFSRIYTLQKEAFRVTFFKFSINKPTLSLDEEIYLPLSLSECLGVLMIDTMSARFNIASSVPFLNSDHLSTCSFERKR
jgi:hypothetical protein